MAAAVAAVAGVGLFWNISKDFKSINIILSLYWIKSVREQLCNNNQSLQETYSNGESIFHYNNPVRDFISFYYNHEIKWNHNNNNIWIKNFQFSKLVNWHQHNRRQSVCNYCSIIIFPIIIRIRIFFEGFLASK